MGVRRFSRVSHRHRCGLVSGVKGDGIRNGSAIGVAHRCGCGGDSVVSGDGGQECQ